MKKNIQFIRYIITGTTTTVVDIALLYILFGIFEFHLFWATSLAFLGALLFSFVMNSRWTFATRNSSINIFQATKILKFLFVSIIGLVLTLFLMWVLVEQIMIFYIVAKILTSGIVLFWNFLANSFWTFSETKKKESFITPLEQEKQDFPFFLSIVIPAYNEEDRIRKTLKSAQRFFNQQDFLYEILVIDDGSSDTTVDVCKKILSPTDRIICLTQNAGKGFAVRSGILEAKGRYVLFCDADGATPFSEFLSLQKAMETYHISIGSRYINKKKSDQPFYRVFFSRIVNFFAQVFLIDGYADTQCGFKLFRTSTAKRIFSKQKIFRYAFDVEMLVLAEKYDYKVAEVGIKWNDQDGSKFSSFSDGIKTFYDFLRIKFYTMFGGYK